MSTYCTHTISCSETTKKLPSVEIPQIHQLSRYRSNFYACGVSISGKGSENLSFLISAKKPKMFAGGWCVVLLYVQTRGTKNSQTKDEVLEGSIKCYSYFHMAGTR